MHTVGPQNPNLTGLPASANEGTWVTHDENGVSPLRIEIELLQ